jgi:hypothetical protein
MAPEKCKPRGYSPCADSILRDLLLYFGTPLVIAIIWKKHDKDMIELSLTREVNALPKDVK